LIVSEYGRLSRRQRLRLSGKRKLQFALALAVMLLILVVIRNWWPQLKNLVSPPDYIEIQAVADSLILQAGSSFALTDTTVSDSLLARNNPRGDSYACRLYGQPWPAILPFEFYVERLQELCRQKSLTCNCQESGENNLDCRVGVGGFDGAMVRVRRTARTGLAGRRVAFLIKNLGALSNSEIMKMVDNGVIFSYLATPDVYPSTRIKNALERAGVTSILEIPAERSNLIELWQRASGKEGKSHGQEDRELVASLFERHPGSGAIIVKRTGGVDSSFVTSIIEEAKKRKAAYIYDNESPDAIDSLAYSSGLVILNMKNIADFSDGRFDHNRSAFLRELILSSEPFQRTIMLEGSAVDVDDLLSLQRTLQRLGVNSVNSISLMEAEESL
jgi:hypothetical protein